MKKIILLAVLTMASFSAFSEEVYDPDGLAIDCNSEIEMSVDDKNSRETATTGSGSKLEG